MKNLVASSIVTLLLAANLGASIMAGVLVENYIIPLIQGVWVILPGLWFIWALKRYIRQRG